MKFFGDGPAANHFAALQNHRLESAFRKIESGDEGIVAAADNDNVVVLPHSV